MRATFNVRSKVIAAFALMLACTFALGLFSLWQLSAVNENAEQELRQPVECRELQ